MRTLLAPLLLLAFAGCRVAIEGESQERELAAAAGERRGYARPFAERPLPPLPAGAPLSAWIAHAETANGEVEAAYDDWLAAIEQVPQAATQDTTAMLGVEHQLDGGSALDRTGLLLMSDAMFNLLLPGRLEDRGRAALERARAAARTFARARLRLQREVAERYYELALQDGEIALQERLRTVLGVAVPSVRARVTAGAASQAELLRAEVALAAAEAELAQLRGGQPGLVARLRAMVGAEPAGAASGSVEPSPILPPVEPLRPPEQDFVDGALAANPDLELLRQEHLARLAEVTAEEWRRVPEFTLSGALFGDGAARVAGALTLPFLRSGAIEASIRAAEARARAADSLRRQGVNDAVGVVVYEVAQLTANADEAAILQQQVLPRLQQIADLARAEWSAGRGPFTAWAEAVTAQIGVERRLLRLRRDAAVGRARLQEATGVEAG